LLRNLFFFDHQDYTKRLLPDDPLVLLDSADLIAEPEIALRAFCGGVGISFERSMLSWERKRVSTFDKWKGFVRRSVLLCTYSHPLMLFTWL
jgi:hypothetical protein